MALISVSNNALSNISAVPASIPTGSLTLISTQTASASASIEFTSGIDSTYDSYVFKFINIHSQTDNVQFQVNFSIDGGSNYNVIKTTTAFFAVHAEADNDTVLSYRTDHDLAQSTSNQIIGIELGNGADENLTGTLQLFNPSSNTFVKHFLIRTSHNTYHNYEEDSFRSGYCNVTNPINAVKFVMHLGTFDGIIKMYGVK